MLRWALDPADAVPVPSWYPVYATARELGIAPWELDNAPATWVARLLELHRLHGSVKRG